MTSPNPGQRMAVLVEGVSDQLAVQGIAERCGIDLAGEGIAVVPMGGATNIANFLQRLGPHGSNLELAGLYDEAEARFFQRGLERAGLGADLSRADMESRRFFVCVSDLEEELIRSLGVASVEGILAEEGELRAFRTFQQQPAQSGKSDEARLRRFLGTQGGRKIKYAPLLVAALDPTRVPRPLDLLIKSL